MSLFAAAVGSTSPIYHDLEAAKAAGFDAIPSPPTWPFAMEFSGKFAEIQPEDDAGRRIRSCRPWGR